MQRYSSLLLVFALLLVAKNAIGQDLCSLSSLDAGKVYKIEDVVACYNSIPADQVWINSTLASLHQLAELYVFTDHNAARIAPWNINVDLHAALTNLGGRSYSKDYAFQKDLINLFNSLYDPNTRYFPPAPYQSCYAIKPFALYPKNSTSDGLPKIYLAENTFKNEYNYSWSINPADYYDWEVTQINGQDTMTYLTKYAEKSSNYKDPVVRVNALFKTAGWNVVSGWSSYNLDNLPSEALSIRKGDQTATMSVSYRAYCSITWNSTAEFVRQIQASPSQKRSASELNPDNDMLLEDSRMEAVHGVSHGTKIERDLATGSDNWMMSMEEKINAIMNENKRKRANGDARNSTLSLLFGLEDDSLFCFIHLDPMFNAVPVLKVQSFAPRQDLEKYWVGNVTQLLDMMQRFNWSYIVLDLSGNRGGSLCEANLLASLLVQNIASVDVSRPEVLWSPYAARKTALNNALYNNGLPYSVSGGFINTQTGDEEPMDSYYNSETMSITFGPSKKRSDFTKFTYYPHVCKKWIANILPSVSYWPANITIITDGTVGNAASVFVAKMKQHSHTTFVTYGGSVSSSAPKVPTAQYIGGMVYSWEVITKNSNITLPFVTSAAASFTFNAIWSSADKNQLPMEFQTSPFVSHHHIMTWDPLRFSDVMSDNGRAAFNTLYSKAMEFWSTKEQPIVSPPIAGLPPVVSTPVDDTPVTLTPVTAPISHSDTPSEGMNTPAMVIVIIIGVILFGCVILFIVFKYIWNEKDGWLIGKQKYRPVNNAQLQESLLDDKTAAANVDANL